MNIVFFEDDKALDFEPLALSHPVYSLLFGCSKIYEKWVKALKPRRCSFVCRPYLSRTLESEGKGIKEPSGPSDFIFINGRFLPGNDAVSHIKSLRAGHSLASDDSLLAFRIDLESRPDLTGLLGLLHQSDVLLKIRSTFHEKSIKARSVNYLWDLVNINGDLISSEFKTFKTKAGNKGRINLRSGLIRKGNIFVAPGVEIAPQVVIDATHGPVIIERGTVVEPLTFIQGPCYVGPNCRIVGGKIREGCSFGPVCRVGGEVEKTIMLGYCNKYHEGFLGHSYLGEWINLGAMTCNSDLKNNYGQIAVTVNGIDIDTGQIKVGCFIGDHTKTGIGTLLNTGMTIGFSCNLYGGGLFTDRAIPSFSWGTPGNLVDYRLDRAMETAAASMNRRDVAFSEVQRKLFEAVHGLAKSRKKL
jgi:UDP-N-acetylglucosamine diphosphorylase/glucosamine-1-phosphate N-acetyltransferase